MKTITQKVVVALSLEEAIEFNKLVDRDAAKEGIPTELRESNKCPKCGRTFGRNDQFCASCGQRVEFVDSDIIPL
jgi:rRNA maturation endonuclease Nob1